MSSKNIEQHIGAGAVRCVWHTRGAGDNAKQYSGRGCLLTAQNTLSLSYILMCVRYFGLVRVTFPLENMYECYRILRVPKRGGIVPFGTVELILKRRASASPKLCATFLLFVRLCKTATFMRRTHARARLQIFCTVKQLFQRTSSSADFAFATFLRRSSSLSFESACRAWWSRKKQTRNALCSRHHQQLLPVVPLRLRPCTTVQGSSTQRRPCPNIR